MTKLFLIISVLLFSLFHSCHKKDIYERLDRKQWFVFKLNDTITFLNSNHTKIDSFKINSLSNGFETTDKTLHQEYFGISFKRINKLTNVDSIFNNPFYRSIDRYYYGSDIRWRNLISSTSLPDTYDTTLTLYNLFKLKNVSVLRFQKETIYPNDIVLTFYCINYGILRYELKNGDVFTIDSTLLRR